MTWRRGEGLLPLCTQIHKQLISRVTVQMQYFGVWSSEETGCTPGDTGRWMERTKIRKERHKSPRFCLHNRLPCLAKCTKGQRQKAKEERKKRICTMCVCGVCVSLLLTECLTDIQELAFDLFESQEKKEPTTNFTKPQRQTKIPFCGDSHISSD